MMQDRLGSTQTSDANGRRRLLSAVVLAVILIASFLILIPSASATNINVTTTGDGGIDGQCSLREAITAANTDAPVDTCPAGSGADGIHLQNDTYDLSQAG